MGLFSKYNDVEKALLDLYAQMMSMVGMSSAEAKKMTGDMLDQAIEESKRKGQYNLLQNLGDIIFSDIETNNPTIKKIVENIRREFPDKRKEGVREGDIRWWWNLDDVGRRMMFKWDERCRGALFLDRRMKGDSPEEAMRQVRKYHPIYGDPDDTTHTTGDDRPLPYELKDRINIYIERRMKNDPGEYKAEVEQSTTFNALIRKKIRAEKL